ncbi:exported hypothetical protein [uncultured delta proteobacterium]|uniref:SprA-related family protein n=1 Tax=uncultured delta proteobacterium TaxID=34034 RepID=A0A212IWZ3_9DELT|nr:exported hypothetical protein [uncultured delta proteobacterium]
MQTDSIQAQQTAATSGVPSVLPVAAPASSAAPENYGSGLFGPAYVREGQRANGESFPVYTADGSLRSGDAMPGDEDLADARAVKALEDRDRQVRRTEDAKGEAVGGSNFIYQMGPDGKRYAIGTAAHAVRQDGGAASGGDAQFGSTARGTDGEPLSSEDEALVQKLEARDAKVRNHEAAHIMAAGGQAAGLATYTYQTGPDGKRYAIGGSVNISMMRTGDAEQDARQAQNAYRAAMATGEPSSRDMQTAARAQARAMEAGAAQWDKALDAYAAQGSFQAW